MWCKSLKSVCYKVGINVCTCLFKSQTQNIPISTFSWVFRKEHDPKQKVGKLWLACGPILLAI